ncbi:MAG TPA: hypothetical protein PLF01_03935 [Alphaproteobacteria bacterium]|nr:hypothetical protein [Alphaproteobacteria bacterium]
MKKYFWTLFLIGLFVSIPVQARIDIIPQKIIIENRERNGEITILNLFDVKGTFRVELVNFSQNQDGIYQKLQAPLNAAFDPEEIVRVSPRQFTLDPYGRQKIRLSLRKPADLPEGEYRFHVKATRLAQDDERKPENKQSVGVIANIGVTIPVVVRHGNVSATAKIDNVSLVQSTQTKTGKPELHLDITRSGNASTMGVLEVLAEDADGKDRRIGRITNMNIFTDIDKRTVEVPLYETPGADTRLIVRYYDDKKKGQIYDEASLSL